MLSAQMAIQTKLNQAYAEAKLRNPAYSLRAFSKKLGLAPSAISEIMNGKRRISRKIAEKIAQGLAMGPHESAPLLALFDEEKEGATSRQSMDSLELQMDVFHMIAEWYHFAILSLAETKGFQSDAEWVAKRLGLKGPQAQGALDRLERLEMLARDKKGRLYATGKSYTTTDEVSNAALRRAHADNLELARLSLEGHTVEERDFTSITMAMDPEKLPVAKKMIREFRDKLCQYLESGDKVEVYKFCMQMIPLSDLSATPKKDKRPKRKEH